MASRRQRRKASDALDFVNRPITRSSVGSSYQGKAGAAAKSKALLQFLAEHEWDGGEKGMLFKLGLAKTPHGLPMKKMVDVAKEAERAWPPSAEYGVAALACAYSTRRSEEEYELPLTYRDSRVSTWDLETFVDSFHNPELLLEKVERIMAQVADLWNERNGGSKNVGNRENVEQAFTLRETVFVTLRGDLRVSTLEIVVNVLYRNRELCVDPDALMEPEEGTVTLILNKGLPGDTQRPTSSLVNIPMMAFKSLMRSDELKAALHVAEEFLEKLETGDPSAHRWRFVEKDSAEEGRELQEELANRKRKYKKRGTTAEPGEKKFKAEE